MNNFIKNYDRRSVLKSSRLALGVAGLPFSDTFGASFPSSIISDTVSGHVGYEFYMGK